jgi:RimJ/RimL family protein N-acetyltransferase
VITTEQNPAFLAWANAVLKVEFRPEHSAWITRLNPDRSPAAVVAYTRFSPYNCEMSIATDGRARWASREFLRVCYSYPFGKLRLARVTGVVEEGNEKALELNRRLGHVQEATLRAWFGEKDGIVFRMLKSECRWIPQD